MDLVNRLGMRNEWEWECFNFNGNSFGRGDLCRYLNLTSI